MFCDSIECIFDLKGSSHNRYSNSNKVLKDQNWIENGCKIHLSDLDKESLIKSL